MDGRSGGSSFGGTVPRPVSCSLAPTENANQRLSATSRLVGWPSSCGSTTSTLPTNGCRLLASSFSRRHAVEPYGRVAVFLDIAGNKWDLLGPA